MHLLKNKTWSRQQPAAKLHMSGADQQGFLTSERRHVFIQAAKTAIAAGVCWGLATLFGMHEGYWGAMTAIIVLQSNFGSTISASRDRLLGTLIGAMFGFGFSFVDALPWSYLLAVACAITVCGLLDLGSSGRLAGVTITLIMLVHTGSHWTLALDRVLQVALGIVVALAVSTLIFPDRARAHLRDGLAQEFILLGAFFEAILQGFRGKPADNLPAAREDVLTSMRKNNQLLEAERHEPSGGPGWREGLNMLNHFGRSSFDALVALELAVKDSHDDIYIQQLEPALGKLAVDVQTGFRYLTTCIHNWQFRPRTGISVEDDISQLEIRMDAVRHTGARYSQDEMLRSYAVLLHLKQIARLLRSTRVETSRAIGEEPE
jgi:uncharacterized membrane protein YccC